MTFAQAPVPRLGVNIDHVATLRRLRGTPYPDLLQVARAVEEAGASQITVHLREDRRHIQEEDVRVLRSKLRVPLNLEMAVTDSMIRFAKKWKPAWACLVPEKRQEVTTEGGLDVSRHKKRLSLGIKSLQKAGIRVSLFVEPDPKTMALCQELGAEAVELHTGKYCLLTQKQKSSPQGIGRELARIEKSARIAQKLGLRVHAGHGLDLSNVRPLAELELENRFPLFEEYNIGHSIICRAVEVGMIAAVREMIAAIEAP